MSSKPAKPTTLLVLGMAGSGKSTFTQRVIAEAEEREWELKSVNLDPAVGGGRPEVKEGQTTTGEEEEEEEEEEGFEGWYHGVPYEPNVDIRDSIDYKQLMRTNELGPNGAIMLSLNMYSTRLNDLSGLVERWRDGGKVDFVCVDTPGQIEVFTWSASGTLFTEMFARVMPTVLVFVVDSVSMQSASTFVSILFHACGVMLRTQLPMVVVFNKTDLQSAEEQFAWMDDLDALQTALDEESEDTQYMASLSASVSLMLHEFLDSVHLAAVSSVTGEGMDDFFAKVKLAVAEFEEGKQEQQQQQPQQPQKKKKEEEIARPFPAPKAKEEEEEEEETKPAVAAVPDISLLKTKQLNAEEYHKRKFVEFDSEVNASSKRAAPPPSSSSWSCAHCHVDGNTGAFCRQCLRSSPSLPTWFCSECHLENAGEHCKACLAGSPLVGSTGAAAGGGEQQRRASAPSSSRRGSQVQRLPNWTCFSCTFFNQHGAGVCQACSESYLANSANMSQNLHLVWQCLECGQHNHVDQPLCPACSVGTQLACKASVAAAVAKDQAVPKEIAVQVPVAVKAEEEEAVSEFKDGQIFEDVIWSASERRFYPLNATRDGKFEAPPAATGAGVSSRKRKSETEAEGEEEEEEEDEVRYEYDEDVDQEEEEDGCTEGEEEEEQAKPASKVVEPST